MKSSTARRTRPTIWDGILALGLLVLAGFIVFCLQPKRAGPLTATVTLRSEVVATYDLETLKTPAALTLTDAAYPITITAEAGRVCISASDCPGRDCVHTGWATRAGAQIVCLPNRLVISVSGGGSSDVDGVTG